ncbi:hypothetical protein ACTFIY_003148 [Dictyostelium cf. discoideum]
MANVEAQIDKILTSFDKDGDGNLTWDEVFTRMSTNSNIKDPIAATKSMFDHYNRDADTGSLSTKEIRDVLMSKKIKQDMIRTEKALKAKVRDFNKKYDTDKNGVVTFDEMYQLYLKDPDFDEEDDELTAEEREDAKCRRAKSSCRYFFSAVDKDKNDKLTYQEIKEYLKKHPEFDLGPSQ